MCTNLDFSEFLYKNIPVCIKNRPKMKLFNKKIMKDNERVIYVLGLRVFSYRKEKIKRAIEYPIRVHEKYHRLKDTIRNLKNSK